MELQKVALKVPVIGDISAEAVQTSFVEWIRDDKVEGTLIDVADYSHMHEGPTVVLVAHEFILSLDDQDGVKGIKISHRLPSEDSLPSRLGQAWKTLQRAVSLLSDEHGLKVDFSKIEVTALDRLNGDSTSLSVLSSALSETFPEVQLTATSEDRDERQLPGGWLSASPTLA
jgi:hypothetical protein